MRALYIVGCFVIGAVCAYVASPFIVKNDAAINIFVTVYSVLAGVLIAVIAVLGDPALLPAGSWQTAEAHRDSVDRRLIRYTWLFGLYLVTVAAIFVSTLLRDAPDDVVGAAVKEWMNRIYLWLGISAFLLSLALPKMLMEIQRARVDAEIDDRRRNQGLNS